MWFATFWHYSIGHGHPRSPAGTISYISFVHPVGIGSRPIDRIPGRSQRSLVRHFLTINKRGKLRRSARALSVPIKLTGLFDFPDGFLQRQNIETVENRTVRRPFFVPWSPTAALADI